MLPERLKTLRLEAKLTQKEIAEKLNFSTGLRKLGKR
jgi:transcriptional regulator with XRE-family HTH domain